MGNSLWINKCILSFVTSTDVLYIIFSPPKKKNTWNSPVMIAGIILSISSMGTLGQHSPLRSSPLTGILCVFLFIFILFYCCWSPDFKQTSDTHVQWAARPFSNFSLIILKLIYKGQRTVWCNRSLNNYNCPMNLILEERMRWSHDARGRTWLPGKVSVMTACLLAVVSSFCEAVVLQQ